MSPEIRWSFAIDEEGRARPYDVRTAVETVTPGEYLVTLPSALSGVAAWVGDGAGFLSAAPGDEEGNKPNIVRVLTMTHDDSFGPRPFTIVIAAA